MYQTFAAVLLLSAAPPRFHWQKGGNPLRYRELFLNKIHLAECFPEVKKSWHVTPHCHGYCWLFLKYKKCIITSLYLIWNEENVAAFFHRVIWNRGICYFISLRRERREKREGRLSFSLIIPLPHFLYWNQ